MITTPQTEQARAVLEEWAAAALVDVPLPSGRAVRVRPATLVDLMVADALPAPLTAIVLAGTPDTEDDPDSGRRGIELVRALNGLAARAIACVRQGDEWIPVSVDAATFASLPPMDRREITKVAVGDEMAEVVAALAGFRDGPAGAPAGDDGADLRPAAVELPRPDRVSRRARPRPGDRA